jgi:hypothetical protein
VPFFDLGRAGLDRDGRQGRLDARRETAGAWAGWIWTTWATDGTPAVSRRNSM